MGSNTEGAMGSNTEGMVDSNTEGDVTLILLSQGCFDYFVIIIIIKCTSDKSLLLNLQQNLSNLLPQNLNREIKYTNKTWERMVLTYIHSALGHINIIADGFRYLYDPNCTVQLQDCESGVLFASEYGDCESGVLFASEYGLSQDSSLGILTMSCGNI